MTTKALKLQIKQKLEKLPKEKLLVANDFISYLAFKEIDNEATKELLALPGILNEIKKAEESVKKGRIYEWRKIRNDI